MAGFVASSFKMDSIRDRIKMRSPVPVKPHKNVGHNITTPSLADPSSSSSPGQKRTMGRVIGKRYRQTTVLLAKSLGWSVDQSAMFDDTIKKKNVHECAA